MLPKHGIVHGAFLLAYTARLSKLDSLENLVRAARNQQSFLASAIELQSPAEALTALKLLSRETPIKINPQLSALSIVADRPTLIGLARLFLEGFPPIWLWSAAANGVVRREYIPSADLAALDWLELDLDALLLDVYQKLEFTRQQTVIKRIGDAAEEMLMAAYKRGGLNPIHVARFYDGCGYDIELPTNPIQRIEVKAASINTQGRFILTRNEYEKSLIYGPEWQLIQVIFTPAAFIADKVTSTHVAKILSIPAEAIRQLAPVSTTQFKWLESAEFTPASNAWEPVSVQLDTEFSITGFRIPLEQ